MRYIVSLFLTLSAFWLINSGHYGALMLFFGLISVSFVVFLSWRMDVVDGESQPLRIMLLLPGYWMWLLKEIVVANFQVVACIWKGESSISPTWFVVKATQKTDLGKVIYANSITLTPGTMSVDLEDDSITVHALTQELADSLESGTMERHVRRMNV
ncbi:MAG: Na+/H+ antiporter subunit E [Pseudomonadales bacterium]|nr:Na+/H+ antiporter subunit E [Pseudomonadales bacterium]